MRLRRLALVLRFLAARARARTQAPPHRVPLPAWNAMFDCNGLPRLANEKRRLESFDISFFSALNDPRVVGQIVFEYGEDFAAAIRDGSPPKRMAEVAAKTVLACLAGVESSPTGRPVRVPPLSEVL